MVKCTCSSSPSEPLKPCILLALQFVDIRFHRVSRAKALQNTHLFIGELNYATSYFCAKSDPVGYDKLLREVLAAEDPDPDQRLSNMVAQRRAARVSAREVRRRR